MQDDAPYASKIEFPAATKRVERQHERFRVAQQRARSEAAGGKPTEGEAARMVAEFYARGGRVTVIPPVEDPAPGNADKGGHGH
jgi:hypothetical protein